MYWKVICSGKIIKERMGIWKAKEGVEKGATMPPRKREKQRACINV